MERFRFDEPEELDEVPFRFRIYHKSELSQLYFPQCSSKTALQNLGRWIKRCTELEDALLAIGYRSAPEVLPAPGGGTDCEVSGGTVKGNLGRLSVSGWLLFRLRAEVCKGGWK